MRIIRSWSFLSAIIRQRIMCFQDKRYVLRSWRLAVSTEHVVTQQKVNIS